LDIAWTWVDSLSAIMFVCKACVPPLAIAMAISGVDDLLVDAMFVCRVLARRWQRRRRHTMQDISARAPHAPIAVLIPAWDESQIITDMLEATLARWHGDTQLRLFVGWYINDPATGRAIAALAAQDRRIVPVVVPHNGPTTKADCLNFLWVAAQAYALERARPWCAFLLHDAEDLVSADEPNMIRHMIAARGKGFVQFPVIPVPVPGSALISGHYLDEFAEAHTKDMAVREWMGAPLPAAGVGCAFEAGALQRIATLRGGLPFNVESLTEDYELGLLISRTAPAAFVRIASKPHEMLVATQEHFPDEFWRAVRQKSRWLTGISLSGWNRFGWSGSIAHRYWLLRDRKAIFAFYINASAYLIATIYVLLMLWQALDPLALHFDSDTMPGWVRTLLLCNGVLLLWRLLVRAACVLRMSGPAQALLSVPRSFVGNMINICAAFHALFRFTRARLRRRALSWDKTAHRYPTASRVQR
jgi:bacteriophage N4 adsorption protein B